MKPDKLKPTPESIIQQQIVNALSMYASKNNFVFFSIPNEGFMLAISKADKKSRYATMMTLKKMGLTPGVPDICIVKDGKAYFMEVKTKDGSLSKVQKIIIRKIISTRTPVMIVRSVKEALVAMKELKIIDSMTEVDLT